LEEKNETVWNRPIDAAPKETRKVFLLSKKSGYKTPRKIAAQLDITEKAVEKHIS